MELDLPFGVVVLSLAAALSAIGLGWAMKDWRGAGGWPRIWQQIEDTLGIFFVVAMLYAATVQVVARYILSSYISISWSEEFARLMLLWAVFWGAAILQRSDDNICATVVFDLLAAPVQRFVRIFGDLLVLAILMIIAWQAWRLAYQQRVMSTVSLGLPISAFILPVAVGTTLMIVHTCRVMVRRIQGSFIASGNVDVTGS